MVGFTIRSHHMTQRILPFLVSLLAFGTPTVWAQTAPLKGTVVEEGSFSPIPNAVISLADGAVLTSSDAQGSFTINVKAGKDKQQSTRTESMHR